MTQSATIYKVTPQDESLFFTPQEVGANWAKYAEERKAEIEAGDGITWGVKSMDKAIIPLGKGKIWAIVARPGHGKSTTAVYLAKRTAKQIAERGDYKSIVVYITVDQPVEGINSSIEADAGYSVSDYAWGRVDLEKVKNRSLRRVNLPIWMMGKSMVEQRRQPRMTYENIYKQLEEVESRYHKKPALIIIDYLQNLPVEGKQRRQDEVAEAIIRARELTLALQTRMILCVQAGRGVDERDSKIPQPRDCQWASGIEQEADAIIGVWRPVLTEGLGAKLPARVDGKETQLEVTQNLFIAELTKQRDDAAGKKFFLHFEPAMVRLSDLELAA